MTTSVVRQEGWELTAPSLHIVLSTGEVSGDLQGSFLVQALHRQAQAHGIALRISALGGQRMAAAGAELVGDTTAIGSIGILEALPYILPTLQVQKRLKRCLASEAIDLVILLDYMGPNLQLGQYLRAPIRNCPLSTTLRPSNGFGHLVKKTPKPW